MRQPSCPGPDSPGPLFGAQKTYPGAVSCACVVTLMTGGLRSGREWKAHVLSPCAVGAFALAVALARVSGSQPRVPPSATHAAPAVAAPRNLRRVIFSFKSLRHFLIPCAGRQRLPPASIFGRPKGTLFMVTIAPPSSGTSTADVGMMLTPPHYGAPLLLPECHRVREVGGVRIHRKHVCPSRRCSREGDQCTIWRPGRMFVHRLVGELAQACPIIRGAIPKDLPLSSRGTCWHGLRWASRCGREFYYGCWRGIETVRKRSIIALTCSDTSSWQKCPEPTVLPYRISGNISWKRSMSDRGCSSSAAI